MRKSRFSDEQIVSILKEHAAGEDIGTLCRRHGISQQTLYRWKAKYDGLEGKDLKRLKALEEENARLNMAPDAHGSEPIVSLSVLAEISHDYKSESRHTP